MIANYHTHTPFCRHAQGAVAEYAQAALEQGMKILGISDHAPYWFPEGYYTHIRMFPHQLDDYVREVLETREAYRGRLEMPLGLEVEYYPKFWEETLAHLRDAGIEYFLLGQHWLGNEMNEPRSGYATEREEDLARYCAQAMDAMQTGLFSYMAHPDMLNYVGDDRIYHRHMSRLCREAKSCAVPLEINMHGLDLNIYYPRLRFWEIASEEGCDVVIGVDAHSPMALRDTETEARAWDIAKRYDLRVLETVPLKPIR